jgi:[histone H3]-dimethyl-L-lysine9 demethylase
MVQDMHPTPLSFALFQVSNQTSCIKAANDFLFPDHLEHCKQLTDEFREENLIDGPWMVDVLQLKRSVLHAYMNIREQCLGLAASAGSSMLPATDVENTQHLCHSISSLSGQFPTFQNPGSSILGDLVDADMDANIDTPQDTLPSNTSSPEVS